MRWLIAVVLALLAAGCAGSSTAPSGSSPQETAMCSEPTTVSRRPTADVSLSATTPSSAIKLGTSARGGAWMARASWPAADGDLRVLPSSVDAAAQGLTLSPLRVVGATAQQDVCWSSAADVTFSVDVRVLTFRAPRVDVHVDAWVP